MSPLLLPNSNLGNKQTKSPTGRTLNFSFMTDSAGLEGMIQRQPQGTLEEDRLSSGSVGQLANCSPPCSLPCPRAAL